MRRFARFPGYCTQAQPVCSKIGVMVSVRDLVDVVPIGLANGHPLQ